MSKDDTIQIDGAAVAARILGKMPAADRKRIVESIRVLNPESAVKIETIILTQALPPITKKTSIPARASVPAKKPARPIAEVTSLSDRDLQDILREVPQQDVVLSLKNATPEVQARIMRKADDIYSEESPNPAPRRLKSRLA
jgi:flagellar motor switch protein FliG